MKIAVQTIGYFMPFLMKGENINFEYAKEILNNIKEMGYHGVQLSGFGRLSEEVIEFYKKNCEERSLTIVATHINPTDLIENLDLVIKAHKEWKCQFCGIGSMPMEYQKDMNTYLEFSNIIEEIGMKLKKEDINFMYHMHAFEFIKYNGKFGLDLIMENTSKENVKLLIDTYWSQYAGINSVDLIKKYSNRIDTIHLKDMLIIPTGDKRFELGKQAICALGEGNINFIPVLEEIKKLNMEWIIIEQDYALDGDINNAYKRSLDYLNSVI
ncbi:sugar phosphate isomerase/epimerase family protein [Cetobacterium sp.]|uniref:sugar phosphate isomerase/epimerase family protein n=1 Tax=Cetobacterium sp. TaxID=2071632 RepID=UPI003F376F05